MDGRREAHMDVLVAVFGKPVPNLTDRTFCFFFFVLSVWVRECPWLINFIFPRFSVSSLAKKSLPLVSFRGFSGKKITAAACHAPEPQSPSPATVCNAPEPGSTPPDHCVRSEERRVGKECRSREA